MSYRAIEAGGPLDVEVFRMTASDFACAEEGTWMHERMAEPDACADSLAGWYYAYGFPGCLWDSDPSGPYDSEDAALAEAREYAGYCPHGVRDDGPPCYECPAPTLHVVRLGAHYYRHAAHGSRWTTRYASAAAWTTPEAAERQAEEVRRTHPRGDEVRVERLPEDRARAWGRETWEKS